LKFNDSRKTKKTFLLLNNNAVEDLIKQSVKSGRIVFWEEVARDGAQAKTILSGDRRTEVAKKTAAIFGSNAPHHLIFAAGFPSISEQECIAIKTLVEQVDDCYLATHGRPLKHDIDLAVEVLKGVKHGRITFLLPLSESSCNAILNKSLSDSIAHGLNIAKYALDKSNGLPVDVALVDCASSTPEIAADVANKLSSLGIAITKVCDSNGKFYPYEISNFIKKYLQNISDEVTVGVHLHNDLGMGLSNVLECLKQNIRLIATSWLGLGERSGLVPTEQLLFALGYQSENLNNKLGIQNSEKLFLAHPDLKKIVPLANLISDFTNVPIRITDPIIGEGVNSISSGIPYKKPLVFQPFNPGKTLGVSPKVFVTHLASKQLIHSVALEKGFCFSDKKIDEILKVIKNRSYETTDAVVSEQELLMIFNFFNEINSLPQFPILEFGKVANIFNKYRPPYPQLLFETIISEFEKNADFNLAIDIGAGTGLSTIPLVEKFNKVIAIEPDFQMADKINELTKSGNIELVNKSIEEFDYPNQDVDLITCGCVFHWIDELNFITKSKKWLKKNGVLAIYNVNYFPTFPENLQRLITSEFKEKWSSFLHQKLSGLNNSDEIIKVVSGNGAFGAIKKQLIHNRKKINVSELIGLFCSFSYFSAFLNSLQDPALYLAELEEKIKSATQANILEADFELTLITAIKQ